MIKQTSEYSNFWLVRDQNTSEQYFVEFEVNPQQDISFVAAKICKKALHEANNFSKIDENGNKSFVLLNLRAINGHMARNYVAVVTEPVDKSFSEDDYKQKREQALTDIPIEFHALVDNVMSFCPTFDEKVQNIEKTVAEIRKAINSYMKGF